MTEHDFLLHALRSAETALDATVRAALKGDPIRCDPEDKHDLLTSSLELVHQALGDWPRESHQPPLKP